MIEIINEGVSKWKRYSMDESVKESVSHKMMKEKLYPCLFKDNFNSQVHRNRIFLEALVQFRICLRHILIVGEYQIYVTPEHLLRKIWFVWTKLLLNEVHDLQISLFKHPPGHAAVWPVVQKRVLRVQQKLLFPHLRSKRRDFSWPLCVVNGAGSHFMQFY